MLTPSVRPSDRGSVLLLFPAALFVVIVLGALVIDVSLSQVRARELESVAASAANDALAALDVAALRSTGEVQIDLARAETIVMDAIANGPLPDATVVAVTVTGFGGPDPEIAVTLTLTVELVMSPALPGDIGSTTITRTRSVSILG